MRVLFDTNVVLDLLLDREPWSEAAAGLFGRVESGSLEGLLCATTVTTIHYLAAKVVGAQAARQEIRKLLSLCAVAPADRPVLDRALEAGFEDFEDGVLSEAAWQANVEVIVTRDPSGFKSSELKILSPNECLAILEKRDREA